MNELLATVVAVIVAYFVGECFRRAPSYLARRRKPALLRVEHESTLLEVGGRTLREANWVECRSEPQFEILAVGELAKRQATRISQALHLVKDSHLLSAEEIEDAWSLLFLRLCARAKRQSSQVGLLNLRVEIDTGDCDLDRLLEKGLKVDRKGLFGGIARFAKVTIL